MVDSLEAFVRSKYHLSVARRLYANFHSFKDKRLLVGVITEVAKASSSLILAYLGRFKKHRIEHFSEVIGKQYLDEATLGDILKSLEVEKAQKLSPIQFSRGDLMILLIGGEYKFLKSERLGDFIAAVERGIAAFPGQK